MNEDKLCKVCQHGQLARSCEICELETEIESLKCCGNCKHIDNCVAELYKHRQAEANSYCDKWESDCLTRKEREV